MQLYSFDEKTHGVIEKSCIPYAIFQMVDERVVTIAVSDGFCDLFAVDRETAYDQLNNHIYDKDHPDDVTRLGDAAISFANGGSDYNIIYRSMIEGEYRIIHARGKHVYTSDGKRLAIIWYSDAGPYVDKNQEIYDQALSGLMLSIAQKDTNNYDLMTGLPSMSYFYKLAEGTRDRFVEEGEAPALLYFDFNDMKNYNLKYGFSEGDRLIHAMSQVLSRHFSDINCCRIGSDHFAVITKSAGLEEELKKIFEECKSLNEGKSLSVRVGIYLHSMGAVSTSIACDRAKMACDVKRDIATSAFNYFNEDMLKAAEMRHYILDNLDKAIRENWITVYYQPIVRSASGIISDEEALARWIDPNVGFLSPADFIPVLEDAKQLYKLDLCVLELTLKKMRIMEQNNLHIVPCSINISRTDFEMCDIVEEIRKRVDDAGIEREKYTIEITESAVGDDIEYIKKQVERFNELGFKVWMDDYGSGYSSPEILQTIPFSTIKLDMQFMRQFDKTPKSRIIISELIKMAMNLGLETVVEGVETREQVDFLREVGATKLQGFYYSKPNPIEEILRRYEVGIQIGLEDPRESEYYAAIGRINLYDISLSADGEEGFDDYFNTVPMAIYELKDTESSIIRCNKSYQKIIKDLFDDNEFHANTDEILGEKGFVADFMKSLVQCGETGRQTIEDKKTEDGRNIHMLFRRLAVNPVTDAKAVAVIMLDIRKENALTYGSVAQALSSDYLSMYYVNLDTEDFIEYKPDSDSEDMVVERRGRNFFEASRRDAIQLIYKEDRDLFINTFNRETVTHAIEKHNSFTHTYRLYMNGEPVYVNMKATAIGRDKKHIIIGVNNVDTQMRQKEAMERIKEERIAYSRISALSGDFIVFYTVDPVTEKYSEYDATGEYESLNLAKEGEDFFENSKINAQRAMYIEDLDMFIKAFTKENVLRTIYEKGVFVLNYRLMISGKPHYVSLKGARIIEEGKEELIFGVNDIDEQVRRDQEYAYNLEVARNKVNLDSLTGVKNKHAYVEAESSLNDAISKHSSSPFAVAVFDINNLKKVNDEHGHNAGDELIKEGCGLICNIFRHSPVFRIGGDEFVVIARGEDYDNIDIAMHTLSRINHENKEKGAVVVAGGMSRFDRDNLVEDVFDRADKAMYDNKKALKEE